MKVAKVLLWILVVGAINFLSFSESSAARIPAQKTLISLILDKGVPMVRFDRGMARGLTTPAALDKDPLIVAEISNGYFQTPGMNIDPKFVVQPVPGNPRELQFPASLIGFDESCQCRRFTTGRPDPDNMIRGKWSFTFELRPDQVGGGIKKVANPPIIGLRPGTTSFTLDIPEEIFQLLTGTSPLKVEGRFLLVPKNMLPTLNGQAFLAFDGNNWHSDRNFPGNKDRDPLVDNQKGFFQVSICGMRGFNKNFNIGVSSSGDGIIDVDKWMGIFKDRVGFGVAPGDINYSLTLTDAQITEVCR